MSRIRSRDTSLELAVRRYLYSEGFRFRVQYRLPGRPDIAFPKIKVAVFVNGCFWHMHGCRLAKIPKTRTTFWRTKLQSNKSHDKEILGILKSEGWRVVILWECQMESDFPTAMVKLTKVLSMGMKSI